jgi:hypothetical protein
VDGHGYDSISYDRQQIYDIPAGDFGSSTPASNPIILQLIGRVLFLLGCLMIPCVQFNDVHLRAMPPLIQTSSLIQVLIFTLLITSVTLLATGILKTDYLLLLRHVTHLFVRTFQVQHRPERFARSTSRPYQAMAMLTCRCFRFVPADRRLYAHVEHSRLPGFPLITIQNGPTLWYRD